MDGQTNRVRASKFLSFVLRHQPEAIGLRLDKAGWVDLDTLVACAVQSGHALDRETILAVVETNAKRRFALSQDGSRIRAVQGHSTWQVCIDHTECPPPSRLYHGTATRFLDSIWQQGLIAGARHHVHLSPDSQTAIEVGKRYGTPVVLTIRALEMSQEGYVFFLSENGVWLTEAVPPRFLEVLPEK